MSLKTALLCTMCKEVLNSQDTIFGTSCGHLYHISCIRECHATSAKCIHCEKYKPSIYQMYLEFSEPPISWKDQEKTIKLHEELVKKESLISELENKYKMSQVSVQKLESKLKTLNDALNSNGAAMEDLKDRIETNEALLDYYQKDNELLQKKLEEKDRINDYNCVRFDYADKENISSIKNREIKGDTYQPDTSNTIKTFVNLFNFLSEESKTVNRNCNVYEKDQIPFNVKNKEEHSLSKEINNSVDLHAESKHVLKKFKENQISDTSKENAEPILNRNVEETSYLNRIEIQNCRLKDLGKWSPKETVVYLAKKMKIKLSVEEVNVLVIKKNCQVATLIVSFESSNLKKKFLDNKQKLKRFENTKYLEIN